MASNLSEWDKLQNEYYIAVEIPDWKELDEKATEIQINGLSISKEIIGQSLIWERWNYLFQSMIRVMNCKINLHSMSNQWLEISPYRFWLSRRVKGDEDKRCPDLFRQNPQTMQLESVTEKLSTQEFEQFKNDLEEKIRAIEIKYWKKGIAYLSNKTTIRV